MKPRFSLHYRTPQVWWHCAWNPSTKEGRPDSQGHHQLHVWDQPGPCEIISKIKILKIAERYSQKVSTLIYNEDNVLVLSKLHKHTLSPSSARPGFYSSQGLTLILFHVIPRPSELISAIVLIPAVLHRLILNPSSGGGINSSWQIYSTKNKVPGFLGFFRVCQDIPALHNGHSTSSNNLEFQWRNLYLYLLLVITNAYHKILIKH